MAKRVLFVAWAPFFSGAERALLLTLRSLDPGRYVPVVLSGTDGEFASQVRRMGIRCDVVALSPLDRRRPLAGLRSVAAVLTTALRRRVSLIHANEAPRFQPAGYAAKLMGIPAITHVRFPASAAGYEWFLRPGFSRALFVSQALLDQAVDEAPALFDGRSEVLHDGVQPQPSWTAEDSIRCRRELDLPEDRTIVAMAGQIAEIKGIWDFVDAARILSSHAPESLFVVVGDDLKNGGQTRRAMEARVAALGLTARFRFLGFRTDVPRVVQAFDIIAVPSHIEPLGNATLEAMATGRPVVGSRVGGIPEMVIDGETGALVPPRDPTALAHAIARLIDDRALRMRMGAAAKQRATMKFSIEAHGERLQCLYDSMCASPVVRFGSRTEAA
jgi:glycosyltransferase involved in cell wall biosynthesis